MPVSLRMNKKVVEDLIKGIGISKLCVERSDCFVRAKWHFALHQRKSRRRPNLRYRKFNAVIGAYCNTPLRANVKNVTECLIKLY